MLLVLPPLPTMLAGWPAYFLFYLLGFGLAGGLLLGEGWRRGWPARPGLLLVTGTVLAFVVGTRLIAGGLADWQALLSQGHWGTGAPVGRSVLGGMLGALLALAGLRRLLGFGRAAADAFALPFVLGLAVQGGGCLLAGCCFGTVLGEGAPGLGLTYGPDSAAFRAQVAQGLLPAAAAHSLPVHAAQLYQSLWCLGIAALLLAGRQHLARRPGLALPLAFGLYVAGRLGLEFGRDPLGDIVGAGLWLGLKPVQWGLLGAALGLAGLAARRLRLPPLGPANPAPLNQPQPTPFDRPLPNLVLMLALLALPPALLPGGFASAEMLVLRALLLPVVALEGARLLHVLRLTGLRPVALLLLSGGLMSQMPADTTRRAAAGATGPALTFGLGGLSGRSYQLYQDPTSCGTPTQDITRFAGYRQRYTGATGSVVYSRPVGLDGRNTLSFGLHGFGGRTTFTPGSVSLTQGQPYLDSLIAAELPASRPLYDINPTITFFAPGGPNQRRHLRLGVGLHLSSQYAFDFTTQPLRRQRAAPSLLLEFGYRRLFWLHSSVLHEADAVGNGTWRIGAGTSFGRDQLTLLGGLATTNSNGQNGQNFNLFGGYDYSAPSSTFAELRWQVSPAWLLEGTAISNFNDVSRLSLGARYRLALPARPK